MSPFEKCLSTLRTLVHIGDINGIRLGEIAIDEFAASLADPERQKKGLAELEFAVTPNPNAMPSSQIEFAGLLASYIQSRIRDLSEDQ